MIHPLTWLGIALILIGLALVLFPIIGSYVDFSQVPSWLVYVYRHNNFYFVTSPLLLMLSIAAFIAYLLMK